MSKKYTATDFANAEFAKHPDGHVAMRMLSHAVNAPDNDGTWQREQGGMCQDTDMPSLGYIPQAVHPAAAEVPGQLDLLNEIPGETRGYTSSTHGRG